MATLRALTMPKWGIEMVEGTIAEWLVAESESFSKGTLLALIETDKITNEVEADYSSTLARIVVASGNTVAVGTLCAVFADGPTTAAELDAFVAGFVPADTRMAAAGGPAPQPVPSPAPAPAPAAAPTRFTIDSSIRISPAARLTAIEHGIDVAELNGTGRGGRITLQDVLLTKRESAARHQGVIAVEPTATALDRYFASPLAKRLAKRHGLSLDGLSGTGPRGRISKADVLARLTPEPAAPPASAAAAASVQTISADGTFEASGMTPMRKAIARQLTLSKTTIPHFYLRFSAQIDALQAMRSTAKRVTGGAPSINDYLIRAVALALIEHPEVNVQLVGDEIRQFAHANISVAVETPRGLVTPVIRAANTKSVLSISTEMRALAERSRAGRISAEEIAGGSFSISNLGMYGIESFDAVINPPQGAILAIGSAARRPMDHNQAIAFPTMIACSLSCDHRVIDGGLGARFCATVKGLVENPERLIDEL